MDKKTFWIAYTILVIGLLFIIELWAPIAYIYKIFLKVFLMLLPLIWVSRSFFAAPDTKKLKVALLLGAGAILIIQGAYLVLQNYIDLGQIKTLLSEQQGITATTYIWVVIYATLGNSMLEEVFFRGFLVQRGVKRPWLFSSALFSFYHLTIFISWFSWWVTLIALFGLFVGGLMFCWLNGKRKSIWNSWAMHLMADVSIFAIGFKIFF
jgi:membrane protease YdiL (CAAX protease family)